MMDLIMVPSAPRPSTVRVAAMVAAVLPYLQHDTKRALELINNVANPLGLMVDLGDKVGRDEARAAAIEAIETRLATRPGWKCSHVLRAADAIADAWIASERWLKP